MRRTYEHCILRDVILMLVAVLWTVAAVAVTHELSLLVLTAIMCGSAVHDIRVQATHICVLTQSGGDEDE